MAASQVGGLMEGDPGPILAGLGSMTLSSSKGESSDSIIWIDYPLVMTHIAMEITMFNGKTIYKWAIFHGYVK